MGERQPGAQSTMHDIVAAAAGRGQAMPLDAKAGERAASVIKQEAHDTSRCMQHGSHVTSSVIDFVCVCVCVCVGG